MLLLKMGPEVPSRARRALPALRRSEKEGVRRTPEPSRKGNLLKKIPLIKHIFKVKHWIATHFAPTENTTIISPH